jgi:hypothetical protein
MGFALLSVLLTARAADRLAYYADADGDGYGDPRSVRYATGATAGYTRQTGDCDDRDASVHPGATELCNGRDDDCDRLDDDEDTDTIGRPTVWYADMDQDGFGDPRDRMRTCVPPYGYVDIADDCDDGDDERYPLAFEFCSDGDDDDCDGSVDECDVSLDDAALVVESSTSGIFTRVTLAVADLDGDGTGDLAVGSYVYDNAVYVLYGPASGEVPIDDAVTIGPTSSDDSFGWGIAGGDADGDGFDDLLVGAAGVSPAVTYVFLGPVTADRDVSDADAMLTNVSPRDDEELEILVMSDHDGDGAADVAVGSADDGDAGGAVYVAPGTSTGTVALDSDATYVYLGDSVDYVGAGIADLGDTNGDGIDELAIGATWADTYIVEGGMAPGVYAAAEVASTTIEGDFHTGEPLQAIDYDGDGAMDLVAGDNEARNSNGDYTGGVFAFVAPWADSMDVDDATAAWEWTSARTATSLGENFAAADFDGDSETDLIIGARGNYDGNNSGAVFFQWGIASGLVDVGSLPYVTGSFDGARLGQAVAALPDWNGDGIPEAAISAEYGPGPTDGEIYGFFSGVSY